jgi:hypothetical protein
LGIRDVENGETRGAIGDVDVVTAGGDALRHTRRVAAANQLWCGGVRDVDDLEPGTTIGDEDDAGGCGHAPGFSGRVHLSDLVRHLVVVVAWRRSGKRRKGAVGRDQYYWEEVGASTRSKLGSPEILHGCSPERALAIIPREDRSLQSAIPRDRCRRGPRRRA